MIVPRTKGAIRCCWLPDILGIRAWNVSPAEWKERNWKMKGGGGELTLKNSLLFLSLWMEFFCCSQIMKSRGWLKCGCDMVGVEKAWIVWQGQINVDSLWVWPWTFFCAWSTADIFLTHQYLMAELSHPPNSLISPEGFSWAPTGTPSAESLTPFLRYEITRKEKL